MSSKILEQIRNVDFKEIDLSIINNELVIKMLQKDNLNKRFPTIGIYSKNLEEMSNQELFSFITELYISISPSSSNP